MDEIKDDYISLFKLLKDHAWENFKKLLNNSDQDIDINMRDEQNEYLLTYAILFNKIDIIELLIEKGAKIDIVDNEERSILYICIKYGYIDTIKYFINKNKESIGINILDIRDRLQKIPLHYAIQKKNLDVIKILLEAGSNSNIYENNGYNALHLAIFTRNIDICKLVIKYIGNINARCNTGETALHIACNLRIIEISKLLIENDININIPDTVHEFTALHYIATTNQIELFKYIIKKKEIDINAQDVFGNTGLHYAIIEENYPIVYEIIKLDNVNFNLWNIDGKIALHLFLENYDDRNEDILKVLIEKSNLSLRDNYGNNSLFYLINLNMWKKYKDILEHKKIDLYAMNKNNIMMIDIINEKDREEFFDIVVKSYLNRLKLNPELWPKEWENICSREFKLDETETKEMKKILKKQINSKEDLDKECYKITKKNIMDNLQQIKEGKIDCQLTSYPLTKNKVCIKLSEGENLSICTFTGNTLDVLLGLIYLLEKHPNTCSTLSSDFIENKNIYDFYKSIGILMNSRSEFLNFEIVWINNKLYLIENFFNKIKKCIDAKSKFIIIPLGIEMKEGSHANYIIYDVDKKIIERFEPHGSTTPPGLNYNPELLDTILYSRFKELDKDITYLKPKNYLPKIGFQLLDIFETKKKKIGDPGGFCALWTIWYVDMRLTYPEIPPQALVTKLIKNIRINNISVKNMIRNYAINVIKNRDEILNSAKLDINNWINDEYTDNDLDVIIDKIKEKISNLKK
jgi:ankyrin repeat protein